MVVLELHLMEKLSSITTGKVGIAIPRTVLRVLALLHPQVLVQRFRGERKEPSAWYNDTTRQGRATATHDMDQTLSKERNETVVGILSFSL